MNIKPDKLALSLPFNLGKIGWDKSKSISLALPFGLGGIEMEVDQTQAKAAWTLYVELMTRIAVQPLDDENGVLREVLNSLYKLFELTRTILTEIGPGVAKGQNSLGPVAIAILNKGLRPFMSKWHPRLAAYEAKRPDGVSQIEHEHNWEHYHAMRDELADVQDNMRLYADALAQIAGAK